jgi:hypothetical protein
MMNPQPNFAYPKLYLASKGCIKWVFSIEEAANRKNTDLSNWSI